MVVCVCPVTLVSGVTNTALHSSPSGHPFLCPLLLPIHKKKCMLLYTVYWTAEDLVLQQRAQPFPAVTSAHPCALCCQTTFPSVHLGEESAAIALPYQRTGYLAPLVIQTGPQSSPLKLQLAMSPGSWWSFLPGQELCWKLLVTENCPVELVGLFIPCPRCCFHSFGTSAAEGWLPQHCLSAWVSWRVICASVERWITVKIALR